MNQQKYNALGYGFWLPCGRANFVSTLQDSFIKKSLGPVTPGGLSFGHLSTVDFPERKEPEHECSVLHKVVEVMKEKNFRTGQLIPPEYLENDFTYDDDPEGILLEGEILNRQNQAIHCKLLVEHNGFYILWTEDTKSLANIDETKYLLKNFLLDLLLGDRSLILNQSEYDTSLPDLKNNPEDHKLLYPYKVEVKDYTGLLPFFQLNMIMEGLNNYFFE